MRQAFSGHFSMILKNIHVPLFLISTISMLVCFKNKFYLGQWKLVHIFMMIRRMDNNLMDWGKAKLICNNSNLPITIFWISTYPVYLFFYFFVSYTKWANGY